MAKSIEISYHELATSNYQNTATYSTVFHQDIADELAHQIKHTGLDFAYHRFLSNQHKTVVCGIHHLNYDLQPGLRAVMIWCNSYDKSLGFRCLVAGYDVSHKVFLFPEGSTKAARRHRGDAMAALKEEIIEQAKLLSQQPKPLAKFKNQLALMQVTQEQGAQVLGELFFKEQMLTVSQSSIARAAFKARGLAKFTAWDLYTCVALGLSESHPADFIKDHQRLTEYFQTRLQEICAPRAVLIDAVKPIIEPVSNNNTTPEVLQEKYKPSGSAFGSVIFA